MKLHSELHFRPGLLMLTPLADVSLGLLAFFLLGSSLVQQSGVRLELPSSSFALQGLAEAHVLVISTGTVPRLLLNQSEVAPGTLLQRLAELAETDRQRGGRVGGLLVKADVSTPHGLVVEAADAALAHGFRVALATAALEDK
jgi:biopolymer transport protein ExbD